MQQKQARYRHELKYSIGAADYRAIRDRLRPVMETDPHTREDGTYRIRSIYFDNYRDKALREKVAGAARREKFRIRWYNDDLSFITLEKKVKDRDLCLKFDAPITRDELTALLSGDTAWMAGHEAELVRELYAKMKMQLLRPRVLVSYEREPYIFRAGNVRVTFDSKVRTSLWQQTFTDAGLTDLDAMEEAGDIILEVKYDDFLPDVIRDLLQCGSVRLQSFSKYEACRRFG